jgi:hypothetical protein
MEEQGNGREFQRGRAQGETDTTLAGHTQHLAKINGSMEKVAERLDRLTLQMQRMADSMEADRATVVKTALALKEADEARRQKGEQRWTPAARAFAVLAVLVSLASLITYILISHGH